jgi:hypothetical protein
MDTDLNLSTCQERHPMPFTSSSVSSSVSTDIDMRIPTRCPPDNDNNNDNNNNNNNNNDSRDTSSKSFHQEPVVQDVCWRQNISDNVIICTGYVDGQLVLRISNGSGIGFKCGSVQFEQNQALNNTGEVAVHTELTDAEINTQYNFVTVNYDQFTRLRDIWNGFVSSTQNYPRGALFSQYLSYNELVGAYWYDKAVEEIRAVPGGVGQRQQVELVASGGVSVTFHQWVVDNRRYGRAGYVVLNREEFLKLGSFLEHIRVIFDTFPRHQKDDVIAKIILEIVGRIIFKLMKAKFPYISHSHVLRMAGRNIWCAFSEAYEHVVNFSYSTDILKCVREKLTHEYNLPVSFDLFTYFRYTVSSIQRVILATANAAAVEASQVARDIAMAASATAKSDSVAVGKSDFFRIDG